MAVVRSVSEITKYIAGLIKNDLALHNVTVRGQISNFKQYSSGHCYFDLKDKDSILKCVIWRSYAERLKFRPENDMQVLATGSVEVYERDGKYQFYVSRMAPDGVGELALAFEQLKERLSKEGLFDAEHKKALPAFPRTIGVVTSPTGAVLRDIYTVSGRRMPSIRLALYPVMVQGAGSAEQIARGIEFFNKKYPVDVLIVGRGGGSMEDLCSFNEEVVVRAIFNSKIPVISAVGHETDFTLADFVADQRAATPSQAAELAVPDVSEVIQRIRAAQERIQLAAMSSIKDRRRSLESLMNSYVFTQPLRMLETGSMRLENLRTRLNKITGQLIKEKKNRLLHDMDKLELINPMGVIRRGYGMVQDAKGNVISHVNNVKINDLVKIKLNGGQLEAQVRAIKEE
ncbi:Exodeoxyribonuclease VII large subunit [Anaerovibrio sp. JC8]|uniref:exodeoxyribonuclease VII large subunit n=1 Tax=Anaerovibrio sp. JC8 TaxID=1240085 RepID=UPI000A0AE8E8|nr:exodeoxyribonuclease VII large subunit [Anaerovibrio sp. JC8]ORT98946.1 Exodeoxyribonuclease VII large subunit [Anaerovibrio sp. JC8]